MGALVIYAAELDLIGLLAWNDMKLNWSIHYDDTTVAPCVVKVLQSYGIFPHHWEIVGTL